MEDKTRDAISPPIDSQHMDLEYARFVSYAVPPKDFKTFLNIIGPANEMRQDIEQQERHAIQDAIWEFRKTRKRR